VWPISKIIPSRGGSQGSPEKSRLGRPHIDLAMETQHLGKKLVKEQVGWVYPDLKWLDEKEAIKANKKRNELLRSLADKISVGWDGNKIHMGKLSPGCLLCGQGFWSCMFFAPQCTANCFYCGQIGKIKVKRMTFIGETILDDPEDYADYLKKFGFRGVGFSGGEPLTAFDDLLKYIGRSEGIWGISSIFGYTRMGIW